MQWKPLRVALENSELPKGYVFEELKKDEIPQVIRLLGEWYPDIQVGSESRHLDPEFYRASVYFSEDGIDRAFFVLTCKHQGKIVGLVGMQKDKTSLSLSGTMVCIAPTHRGQGLAPVGPLIIEAVARSIGAELAYSFVTLKIPHPQAAAEKAGFKLVGIVPAYDRDLVAPGVIKRVYEAIYAKVLVEDSEILVPPPESLTPNTKKLWDLLFGSSSSVKS